MADDKPLPSAIESSNANSYIAGGEEHSIYKCPVKFCSLVGGLFCCLDGNYVDGDETDPQSNEQYHEFPARSFPEDGEPVPSPQSKGGYARSRPSSSANRTPGYDSHRPFWDCRGIRETWREDRTRWQGVAEHIDDECNNYASELLHSTGCFDISVAEIACINPYPSSDRDG